MRVVGYESVPARTAHLGPESPGRRASTREELRRIRLRGSKREEAEQDGGS